jgi:hypothetical protein
MAHVFESFAKATGLLLVVLLVAEIVFTACDRGAFTEPNFYVLDPELGVRLIPNSQERLAYLGMYPSHTVHINSEGYRGGEFPERGEVEIAVFGDSLSFGLGVGDDQTFPARLQSMLGKETTVLNYSVPSYGLHEQVLLVEEILKHRLPDTVVFTISTGRFFGKTIQPYAGRFLLEDGWMIQGSEYGDPFGLPLPGSLNRWSHLINAFRRASLSVSVAEFSSKVIETRWKDLLDSASRASAERERLVEAGWGELRGPGGDLRAWSTLLPYLRELKAVVEPVGVQAILLLLPQDVQIDPTAWSKYGLEPQDPISTFVLYEDLVATAGALDFSIIDGTEGLKSVTPGAFLPRDWHMSAKGHQAIANVVHRELENPEIP